MFDYIRFDATVIENGETFFVPSKTFTKVADGGLKSVIDKVYLFTVYRVDYESNVEEIPSEFHVYGTQGDAGSITSAKALNDSPKVTFEDDETPFPLDFFGSFSTKAEAVEVMNSGYPIGGCTSPESANYNPSATLDDGSCKEVVNYTPYLLVGGALVAVVLLV